MWAATEADIKDVIAKGLVPGSSIGSSGIPKILPRYQFLNLNNCCCSQDLKTSVHRT